MNEGASDNSRQHSGRTVEANRLHNKADQMS